MEKLWNFEAILSEPPAAIVILDQPILLAANVLLRIWNIAGCRITVDGGANRWLTFIKELSQKPKLVDLITGDFDSITDETRREFEKLKIPFYLTSDQDETDFTKALRILSSQVDLQDGFVICLCEHSGRLDQIMANLETLYHSVNIFSNKNNVVLLTRDQMTVLLLPNIRHKIKVPLSCVSEEKPCGLIPLSGSTVVTSSGLKWDLDTTELSFGTLVSTSNTYKKNEVTIETSKPLIFTSEY